MVRWLAGTIWVFVGSVCTWMCTSSVSYRSLVVSIEIYRMTSNIGVEIFPLTQWHCDGMKFHFCARTYLYLDTLMKYSELKHAIRSNCWCSWFDQINKQINSMIWKKLWHRSLSIIGTFPLIIGLENYSKFETSITCWRRKSAEEYLFVQSNINAYCT